MPKLYNANDGITGRDGGPYLDQVEARHAEDRRAEVEGRDPDYSTMPLGPGVVYVTAAQLLASESVNNLPSQFDKANAAKEAAITALVENDDVNLTVAFDAPDVPDDDGLNADERQAVIDKALAPKKVSKRSVASK